MFDDLTKGTYCISMSLTALRKQITPMMYLIMLKVHVLYMCFCKGAKFNKDRNKQKVSAGERMWSSPLPEYLYDKHCWDKCVYILHYLVSSV